MIGDKKVYKVLITKDAKSDLVDLEKFYYDSAGLEAAIRFEEAVSTVLEIISEQPYSNRILDDRFGESVRRIFLPKRKTMIVYRIDDDRLEVIAIAAGHSDADFNVLLGSVGSRL
jgi:plasmid stabilization system protein ParE